ncbi:MAG: hypothetical protein ABDH49_04090 [Candidatus Hydrothermales bacterium]
MKKILIIVSSLLLFLSCREREGQFILRVSLRNYKLGIDVVKVIDSIYVFTYDTISASFTFEAVNTTLEETEPVLIVDSFKIEFFDLSSSPPQKISFDVSPPYRDSVSITTYPYLLYKLPFEVLLNETVTLPIPVLPSYVKRMYQPFYNLWHNRDPQVLNLKAVYTFYSHEHYTGKKLDPVNLELTLEVSDFADEE